jgi:hypothetical protein
VVGATQSIRHLPVGADDIGQAVPHDDVTSGGLLGLLRLLDVAPEGLDDADLGNLLGLHGAVVEEGGVLRLEYDGLVLARRDLGQPGEGVPAQ